MASQPRILKLVLIGDGGVGKSSVMNRFITGEFDSQSYHTIGVEFLTKNILVENKEYTLQIWDTAGQERFKSLRTPFYRGADCCILTYAVDDSQSFLNLPMWKREFIYYADIEGEEGSFPFIVIGNKVDVSAEERKVKQRDADNWCRENGGYPYIETSAKDATNVQQCFIRAVKQIVTTNAGDASIRNVTSDTPTINLKLMGSQQSKCC